MYFKRLEMHGFKSFAEPVVIEFHEGVTAVVGPNGSGKSNISDAIRWVLGEQSPKALRGGKMEEVIFAGTASRKSRGMAEVTLVIDNSTGILPIDYNEVAITRRMFRSGESEYMINNNQCRLRDIRELIMDTGIGVDGYSLIGQGKIADIVSNKPESRREIFEEAAGVVMYKSKKAEAEKKLVSTNQNLERANDIIGEIESRIDGLREDSIKAKEAIELEGRYKELEINITLQNIEKVEAQNEVYRTDIDALTEKLEGYEAQKAEVDKILEADREKSEQLEQLANNARDNLLNISEKISQLSNESNLNASRLENIDANETRLKDEIAGLEDKLAVEEAEQAQLEKAKAEIQRKHDEEKTNLLAKIGHYNEMADKLKTLDDQIESNKDKVIRLHNEISGKKSEIRSYDSIKDALEDRQQSIKESGKNAEQNKGESAVQLEQSKEALNVHNATLERVREQKNHLLEEKRDLQETRRTNRVAFEDLKLKGGQKLTRKKTIEEMESNYEGYNFAVKYIMRAGLSGIEGVVAELMQVPEGFETAIETALGAQMQNIVCGTDQDAKKAVNALKENKAGRLTFLPVSSIKGGRGRVEAAIEQEKGYKGLAVDCIQFDGKYKAVFEYMLGRVAIVEDMDTAIKLSKVSGSGLRFVTLDGEIINVSGAITGGKYKNKTANLLERKSEISKLEQEIDDIRQKMLSAEKAAKEAEERLLAIDEELKTLDSEQREAELAKAGLDSTISALEDVLNNFDAEQKKAGQELIAVENDLALADQTVAKLRTELEQCNEEIGRIEDATEELFAVQEVQRNLTKEASEAITTARIAVTQLENEVTNEKNLLDRVSKTVADYQNQIEEKKVGIKELEEERNRILFGKDDREEQSAKLLAEKAEVEEYIKAVTQERTELNDQILRVAKEQEEAGKALNGYRDQKYQTELRLGKNEAQVEAWKEKLWSEFEMSYAQAKDYKKTDFVLSTAQRESREIKARLHKLGDVNRGAIKEYDEQSKRLEFLTTQREDILTAMDTLKSIIAENDNIIKTRFKSHFDQIVENFEGIFKELFGGGHAELRMEDENNPLESGIDIIAQPPGKKLQNINLMSGGEKTMTAIALMFAVLKTKPTPFCILDEVEAALDDANIDRFAKYLRKFENIQFTLVTHQKATMEHADVLYGVTMPEHGISRVLSLRLGDDFEL
ncbi:MAG: chromosome segregation protein SMC [Firmicutes bacterium]|nr:chromosome segregation protein SMC [Bacillota bacterium]